MGNKSSPELTFSFLLLTSLCLEASINKGIRYYPAVNMNWIDVRLFCQNYYIDMITWEMEETYWPNKWYENLDVKQVWIGVLRDPEIESVWKEINVKTGEGASGDDVSKNSNWADGEPISHCAAVMDDLMWNSSTCSSENYFYCSVGDTIQHNKTNLSWHSASLYCNSNNICNLATITQTNADDLKEGGWIGLYREGGQTWSWIGDSQSDYRNWAPGQPLTADCASFDPVTKKWQSNECSKHLSFACSYDNLVMVNENKTWGDALHYCRNMGTKCDKSSGSCQYSHDLLSLQDLTDYNYVRDRIYRATTNEVWTGLRFLGGEWWWLNGQKPEDQGMLPDCPSQQKHCGTLSKIDTDNWIIRDCSERRNFICISLS